LQPRRQGLGHCQDALAVEGLAIAELERLYLFLEGAFDRLSYAKDAIPLRPEQQRAVFSKCANVIRATVKGTFVVAVLQGALGGLIFWFLGIRAALYGPW
jgi:hypothetical protein